MEGNKTKYVADASVILKWFFDEANDRQQALALRDDFLNSKVQISVPHHAIAEMLNFIGRKESYTQAMVIFNTILNYRINEHPLTFELASIAVELMKKFPGISFYDAGYHALALRDGGIFITADAQYYKKTKKAGSVMLLKDYGKK